MPNRYLQISPRFKGSMETSSGQIIFEWMCWPQRSEHLLLPVNNSKMNSKVSPTTSTVSRPKSSTQNMYTTNFTKCLLKFSEIPSSFQGIPISTTMIEYNDRVVELERSFLLPPGYPRHPHQRHLVYGPDNEDESRGALFPHLVVAIRQARKRPISPALSYVRENLSLVVYALQSASQVLSRSLLRGAVATVAPSSLIASSATNPTLPPHIAT